MAMSEILVIVDSAAKGIIFNDFFAGRAETVICQTPPLQPVYRPSTKDAGNPLFTFKELPAGREVIAKISKSLDKEIYLALDSDSRSEYCAWLINAYVQQTAKSRILVRRLILNGLSRAEIDKSLKQVSVVDEHKGLNFYIRALFDIYLGRHLTRLIGTKNGPGNLPLTFNSLGTVFFLAEREAEIQMFAPPEKWQVMADLRLNGNIFASRLEGASDLTTDGVFRELHMAEKAVELVREDKFVVDVVDHEDLLVPPPTPYRMVELLHDAFVLCDSQLHETLDTVSKLFYGIEVEGKTTGLISSFCDLENTVCDNWQAALRKQVIAMHGEDALGDGLAESISRPGMIYPLCPELCGSDLSAVLTSKEREIYDLLRCRALASQMRPATGENIRVEIAAGPESLFISKFHNVTERGFMNMYQGGMDKQFTESCPLANISVGDEVAMLRVMPEKTVSLPMAYTIETMFADLEEFSIAVEPANILMLQRMMDAGYINVSRDGYWRPGEKNIQVETIMKRAFPRMQGVNLSAYIAQTITEVTSGRKGLNFALKQFEQTLMGHGKNLVKAKLKVAAKLRSRKRTSNIIKQLDEETSASTVKSTPTAVEPSGDIQEVSLAETATPVPDSLTPTAEAEKMPDLPVDRDEPKTQELQVESEAEGGLAEVEPSVEEMAETVELGSGEKVESSQDGEPDTWSAELQKVFEQSMSAAASGGEQLPELDEHACDEIIETEQSKQCQVCGKPMQLKKDRFGKFWSCSAFPKCRHSEVYSEADVLKMLCPLCGDGKIIEQRMPTGKIMYVCPEADCEFMAWARPYNIPCQVCDSTYLVEKKALNGAIDLRCPRAGCNYKLPLPGSADNSAPVAATAQKKKKVRVRRVPKGSASGKKVRVVRRKK